MCSIFRPKLCFQWAPSCTLRLKRICVCRCARATESLPIKLATIFSGSLIERTNSETDMLTIAQVSFIVLFGCESIENAQCTYFSVASQLRRVAVQLPAIRTRCGHTKGRYNVEMAVHLCGGIVCACSAVDGDLPVMLLTTEADQCRIYLTLQECIARHIH